MKKLSTYFLGLFLTYNAYSNTVWIPTVDGTEVEVFEQTLSDSYQALLKSKFNAEKVFQNADGSFTFVEPRFLYSGVNYSVARTTSNELCPAPHVNQTKALCKHLGYAQGISSLYRAPNSNDEQLAVGSDAYYGVVLSVHNGNFVGLCKANTVIASVTCSN